MCQLIGYRPFTGRRQGTGAIAASLYLTSLQHSFGIRRSGKSKVIPFLVLGIMLIPALVLAGMLVQLHKMSLSNQADLFGPLSNYFGYPYWTQLLITVFAAAQAPVLFARDLRYRTIALYFVVVLALALAAFSGMVAALTTRAGLAVAAIIVGLLVTSGIVIALIWVIAPALALLSRTRKAAAL